MIPNWEHCVVVSPDEGAVKKSVTVANDLNLDFALIHNRLKASREEIRHKRYPSHQGHFSNQLGIGRAVRSRAASNESEEANDDDPQNDSKEMSRSFLCSCRAALYFKLSLNFLDEHSLLSKGMK